MLDRRLVAMVGGVFLAACGHTTSPAPPPAHDAPRAGSATPPTAPPTAPPTGAPGSPVEVVLTSPLLAPYWHADRPGRVPVLLIRNERFTLRPEFDLGGAPVRWIDRSELAAGQAAVEFNFENTDGLLTVTATYAVEGVAAQATFVPHGAGDGWDLTGPVRLVER